MSIRNTIERLASRLLYGEPDFAINKGDRVRFKYWSSPVTVVDVNWTLRVAALELPPGFIVVWPVGGLTKIHTED